MQNYKDLKVWQKAHELVLEIYKANKTFPKDETYGLSSQLKRSAVSIAANLAEGCGKMTSPDIAKFFQIPLGSLHETEYYILLAKDLGYIDKETFINIDAKIREVKAMLIALIKTVRNS